MTADDSNRRVYSDPSVVRHYARASGLQPAEETILATIQDKLPTMTMLDVGVGGGRTTVHFGSRASRYVGLDYSPVMITAANERFAKSNYEFILGDARALPFEDESFDFVLFSHNGIDYVEHEDRLRILGEIRRVLRKGGIFVFSTHNLDRDDLDFSPKPGQGAIARTLRAFRRARLRAKNPFHETMRTAPYAMVNDGSFAFRAMTYHIRRPAQLEQLGTMGFESVSVYSATTGAELAPHVDAPTDPWLYFVCHLGGAL